MIGQSGKTGIGIATVVITNGGPHGPEALAELCANRILNVSATVAEPLRLQGEMFRAQLITVLVKYLRLAADSERQRIAQVLGDPNITNI